MNNRYWYLLGALAAGVASAQTSLAEESLVEALKNGEASLHLRLRYEDVDQDGLEGASATTLKTRLTYTSGSYQGFSGLLEMDDTRALTDVDYADGTGINPGTAVIADPEGTEINQAYVNYHNADTLSRYGRQRILLDNQRFVGGVGWRQNEQTYDAFSITNNGIQDFEFFYGYVFNVNRVFGATVDDGKHQHDTHLINVRFSGWSAGTLIGYGYLLENESAPALSSDTFGLRWQGSINDYLSYNLEYARQTDAGDNPVEYAADYMLAEGLITVQGIDIKLGYEVLGSDNGEAAFSTPLATLHAFQGWTDKFLATPDGGVEDLYLSVGKSLGGVNLSLVYHDLSSAEGDVDYGSELGLLAGTQLGPIALTAKYADYSSDDFATDTRKFWLMAAATF